MAVFEAVRGGIMKMGSRLRVCGECIDGKIMPLYLKVLEHMADWDNCQNCRGRGVVLARPSEVIDV